MSSLKQHSASVQSHLMGRAEIQLQLCPCSRTAGQCNCLLLLESSVNSSWILHNFLSKTGNKSLHILHLHVGEQSEKQQWKVACEGCLSGPVTSLQRAVMRTRAFTFCCSAQCSTSSGALSCFSESGINHITSDSRSAFEMCLQISPSACQQSAQVMLIFV